MFKSNIVRSACCAVVLTLCCGVNGMNNEPTISGIEYENSQIGFFYMHLDDNGFKVGKKLEFEEYIDSLGEAPELPTTGADLETLLRNEKLLNKSFEKISTEVMFCCMEQKNLDDVFSRLRSFASLLSASDDSALKKRAIKDLFFYLWDPFSQLTNQIEEHELSKNLFSLSRVASELNCLNDILDYHSFYTDVFPNVIELPRAEIESND